MKRINFIKSIFFIGTIACSVSCTNLEEEVLDGYITADGAGGNVNTGNFLQSAYEGLRGFQDQDKMFTMNEMSGDGLVGPTRGGDWDDNAKWRQFHVHTWGSDNVEIRNAWNSLLTNVYNCNLVINNTATAQQKTQARFLRAFYYYNVIDLFGQAPYREVGSLITENPKFWSRKEATAFVISELEAVLADLPARVANDASIANKDAGNFLLAKLYLNKGVFNADNASGPYTFDAADMNKVITHVNAINSSLASEYWSNFAPTNNTSGEILFSSKNVLGTGGGIQSRWRMSMHYNQTPDGWNGFATVAEYYNRFAATDDRRQHTSSSIIANFGNPIGFQAGQMFAPGGVTPLKDRTGRPLFYTSAVTMITSGTTLETAGIRTQKYEPDNANLGNPANDYVLMRYSDALLMKAEAALRGGAGGAASAKIIIDQINVRAKLTPSASLPTLDAVYLERGKELWYEGWRRNDMIRFEKFLAPRELKPTTSNGKYALYPIPADALFNPNVVQNPGY
ncbi:RagB/SusD family nutrient uptake outer membrane protein [Flavobacterium sp. DSR2-3-3]|uniref:RagB/SusD family nutrient uptake outer membrane protein n=1 Tax=Flavobacterium sp. DSR2-3-3 TaxID=2804632 RepID=UPI003CFB430D